MAEQATKDRSNQNYKGGGRDNGNMPEEKQFSENVVSIDRVSRVVKGGRRFRFRALIVLGDGKGKVGVGVSKGQDVQSAVQKAADVAKKNMINVPLYNETIPHEADAKVGGAHILIKPAATGTGLKAGGVVRTILEAAGVHNILSKSLGSSNKINSAYATIAALEQLVASSDWTTAEARAAAKPKKAATKAAKEAK